MHSCVRFRTAGAVKACWLYCTVYTCTGTQANGYTPRLRTQDQAGESVLSNGSGGGRANNDEASPSGAGIAAMMRLAIARTTTAPASVQHTATS